MGAQGLGMTVHMANQSISIVIATKGRPRIVAETVRRIIKGQTYSYSSLIISCSCLEDVGDVSALDGVTVVIGPAGLAAQRNAALSALPSDTDIVVFFDDDFIPESNWLDVVAQTFAKDKDIVGVTGHVLADGIKGPGFTFAEVDMLLKKQSSKFHGRSPMICSPYGCNMAFRYSSVKKLRFDERLVSYGWLEDRDFGASLAKHGGRIVKIFNARGIHMGVKNGRVAGDCLGYSQVVNPVYMMMKGTMTLSQVVFQLTKNLSRNAIGILYSESYVDRRGRFCGNLRGLYDVCSGMIEPERATRLHKK